MNNSTTSTTDVRLAGLEQWLGQCLSHDFAVTPLTGDASFRRYFRIAANGKSFVAMDAPPDKEPCAPFIGIAQTLHQQGLHTPEIFHQNDEQGFVLLEDFGNALYLNNLEINNVEQLYGNAVQTLLKLQTFPRTVEYAFTDYDTHELTEEMDLGLLWYFQKFQEKPFSRVEEKLFADVYQKLINNALHQPQVCVHRDYHSRNLMVLPDNKVGLLDFQDAVWGPITYDFVSLVRDCYIDWPVENVNKWVKNYFDLLTAEGLLTTTSFAEFTKWFDWMGLQRHIKCLGIFARLEVHYNKPGYIGYIPRVLQYMLHVTERYPEFKEFHSLLKSTSRNRLPR